MRVVELKVFAILPVLLVFLSVFSIVVEQARADGGGPWGGGFPATGGSIRPNDDRNGPSSHYDVFSEFNDMGTATASASELPKAKPLPILEAVGIAAIVALVVFAAYLIKNERSPEQALEESANATLEQ